MSFASIAIKTSIPATAPAATSGALTFITIEDENWLQITGDASAGSGSLYVLRWNADLAEWRPYMEDKPIAVDSATLNGLFSAYYPFPKGEESFVLYDPASAITATASAARTGSPLAAPTPASSGASGGATEAKQDAGNASLVSILGQLDSKTSTLATASAQTTANSSLASILGQLDSKTSTLATEATISAIKTLLGAGLPAALVGGKLDVNLGTSSITLSVSGPLTDAQLRATPVPVSQGAGSGAAGTFWYTRVTDGTNALPTMDTAARSGYQRITDGTNTAAVKAASTAAVASDPAVAVSLSPNSALPTGDNTIGRTKITDGTNTATVKAASTAPTASDTALVATLSPNSRPGGGSSFAWFSTATGSLLKTGAGVVRRIIIGSNVAGTVTLHDNTSATGTVITSVTSTTSTPCNQVELGVAFSTGLYCTTTGSGISVTVVYD